MNQLVIFLVRSKLSRIFRVIKYNYILTKESNVNLILKSECKFSLRI